MKGKISTVFLILSISISSTKSAIVDNFASPYVGFAKCLKMTIFHTFENRVIFTTNKPFLIKLFLPYNKFEMILESIKTI